MQANCSLFLKKNLVVNFEDSPQIENVLGVIVANKEV